MGAPKKKEIVETTPCNTLQKAEIERMKKLLSEKIKDPKLAKKAAMIITEMLNQKS
jgi:hypothetical protein